MKYEKYFIWLVWCAPNCPELMEKAPEGVIINAATETWTFRGQTIEFGRAVLNPWEEKGTPLGVYDKTDLSHLKQMMLDYRRLALPRSP